MRKAVITILTIMAFWDQESKRNGSIKENLFNNSQEVLRRGDKFLVNYPALKDGKYNVKEKTNSVNLNENKLSEKILYHNSTEVKKMSNPIPNFNKTQIHDEDSFELPINPSWRTKKSITRNTIEKLFDYKNDFRVHKNISVAENIDDDDVRIVLNDIIQKRNNRIIFGLLLYMYSVALFFVIIYCLKLIKKYVA